MRLLTVEDFEGLDFENKSPFDVLLDVSGVAREILLAEEKQVLISQPSAEMKKMTDASTCNFKAQKKVLKSSSSLSSAVTTQEEKQKYSVIDQDDDGDNDRQLAKPESTERRLPKVNDGKMKKSRMVANNERPDLPERFRQRINELNGRQVKLVIQKRLFNTDLSFGHDRLSIPFLQIINKDFLTDEEKAKLSSGQKETIEVPIIDPQLRHEDIKLTLVQWNMKKASGKICSNYALRSKWKKVVKDNNLKEGQVLQIWSFRVQDSLHMALVVLPPSQGMPTASTYGIAPSSSGSHCIICMAGSSSVVTDEAQVD